MTFKPGEIVDVTIRGARVTASTNGRTKAIAITVGPAGAAAYLTLPAVPTVEVTRVAPAHWPPQPADVWRDRLGIEWYARGNGTVTHAFVSEVRIKAGDQFTAVDELLRDRGPLELVRRRGDDVALCLACKHLSGGHRQTPIDGAADDPWSCANCEACQACQAGAR